MGSMKVTAGLAMRARDVSRPRPEHVAEAMAREQSVPPRVRPASGIRPPRPRPAPGSGQRPEPARAASTDDSAVERNTAEDAPAERRTRRRRRRPR